jgi:hypothetical protein
MGSFLRVLLVVAVGLVVLALVGPAFLQCVVAGSQIATPSGPRAVEALEPGDVVWTQGPHGPEEGRVSAVYRSWALRHRVLGLADGRSLGVTETHPIATDAGWVRAGEIEAPRVVITWEGSASIETVKTVLGIVGVYDLSVEPNPNFFANGVLTHNKRTPASANTSAALGWLRGLASGQAAYQAATGFFGMPSCLSRPAQCLPGYPSDRPISSFLDPDRPWEGEHSGYVFTFYPGPLVDPERVRGSPPAAAASFERWAALGVPTRPGETGLRSFCIEDSGKLCFTDEGELPRIVDARCTACKLMD